MVKFLLMIAKIRINRKQLEKLNRLIIDNKFPISIIDGNMVQGKVRENHDFEVTIDIRSNDPGVLFDLGIAYKSIRDDIIF